MVGDRQKAMMLIIVTKAKCMTCINQIRYGMSCVFLSVGLCLVIQSRRLSLLFNDICFHSLPSLSRLESQSRVSKTSFCEKKTFRPNTIVIGPYVKYIPDMWRMFSVFVVVACEANAIPKQGGHLRWLFAQNQDLRLP